jgi:hypothetical protein
MTRRRGIALLVLAGALAALLFYLWRAVRDDTPDPAAERKAAGPPGRGLVTAGTGDAPPVLASRRTNDLGQPLDERGKPIGPPAGEPQDTFVLRIEPGELPMNPPRFADPADRARYRAYWVRELERRLDIWKRENPGRDYPGGADTQRLLEQLYDAGELPGENEGQAALDRQTRWAELYKQFIDRYHTTPGGAAAFGSDPQYGPIPEPPVRPAGYDEPPPEATTEYDDPLRDPIRAGRVKKP